LNKVEHEKESLHGKLDDSHALICKLQLEIVKVNDKNKSLENALNETKDKLRNFSGHKLDEVLSCQQSHGDKYGIGFMNASSSVSSTSCMKNACDKKVVVVPFIGDKGKEVVFDSCVTRSKLDMFPFIGDKLLRNLFQLATIVANLTISDQTISS
jgi:hypothetical protein